MSPALIALLEGIISSVPEAIALWNQVKPILTSGTEPTADQWATLNAMADAAHAAVQAAQPPAATA